MKTSSPNIELTVFDRIRYLVGTVLVVTGLLVVAVILFSGDSRTVVWIVGFGCILVGVLVAGSVRLTSVVADFFR